MTISFTLRERTQAFLSNALQLFRTTFLPLPILVVLASCSLLPDKPCCEADVAATQLTGDAVTVLSLNIAHGRKNSLNQVFVSKQKTYKNLDDIADLLKEVQPDFSAFQEADDPSRWSGGFDHVAYLAEQTGWPNYVHGTHADGWLYAYGTAILSPHELSSMYVHDFQPSFPSTTKGFVAATVDWQQAADVIPLTVISVHLDFMRQSVRQKQVNEMLEYIQSIQGPYIVAGDFNGELNDDDSAVKHLMAKLGLRAFEPDSEVLGTYKSATGKRLDWILISKQLEFEDFELRPENVSDHLAIVARISYSPQ
jgi:endonuclease/exonuclease/phosphatase family metal-dependent hydrolase